MKTNVVLLDTADYGNGAASVFPDPWMVIYLTDWSTNLNPSKYNLWLKFVFVHEYTHILHLDIAEGYSGLLRFIFGRVVFPNALEPLFFIEGYATYSETKNDRWGRGRDPRWEMMMRMDVLEKNIKSFDQAAASTVRWPLGHLRYLYGVEFIEYLAEKYGEEKLVNLAHVYGDFFYTYGVDGAFFFLYRKSLGALWNEWLEQMQAKYEKQKETLGKLTAPKLITDSGYHNLKPKWSKDSKSIYYQQKNAEAYPGVRLINLESKQDSKLIEGSVFADNLSLSPTGNKLLFSKSSIYSNFYTYKDLYLYDLEKKNLLPLTQGMRAGNGDFSSDGSKIVFVKNELGTHSLMIMGSEERKPRLVCSYEAKVQYFSPRWSPDGSKIAVAKWVPGGDQKIYLVDAKTGSQVKLTFEDGFTSEANPCFSPDGNFILFDSDQTGIVNLYAYHLKSRKLFQVTNVLGGAMMPDVSPDGRKIAYVSYSSKGYDIAAMEVDMSTWKEILMEPETEPARSAGGRLGSIKEEIRNRPDVASGQVPSKNYELHDYNPLPSLLPKFWLPLGYTNENGSKTSLFTFGRDVLYQHYYLLSYGYDWEAKKSQYSFLYINNQFLPQITLQLTDASVPYGWDSATLWMREKTGLVSFTLFDNRVFSEWDQQSLTIGYEQTNINNISSLEALTTKPSLGNINGLLLIWRYLNTRRYAKSISPEDGIDLTVRATMNSSNWGSNYSYTNYNINADAYFRTLLPQHVFVPSLYGFYSQGEQLEQSNYSWKYLPIRGYPSTNLRGNKGILLANEYRFPISYLEKGLYYASTFFDRIWGTLFFDMGGANFGQISALRLKRSYGMELNLDTLFFTYGAAFKFGYAKGLDEDGEEKFYFTVGL